MALTLHHLEQSRSHRLIWLLEELGLEYELKRYPRHPETSRAPKELRRIHALGKAPILTDGEVALAETGAIIEHVLEHHAGGKLKPEAGSDAAREFRFFMHYAEGSLMPPLLVRLIFDKLEEAPVPFFIRPIVKTIVGKVDQNFTAGEVRLHADFLEGVLREREWFAGDEFTAADIQMSFPVEALVQRGRLADGDIPKLRAFLRRIRKRPAHERATELGGEPL